MIIDNLSIRSQVNSAGLDSYIIAETKLFLEENDSISMEKSID